MQVGEVQDGHETKEFLVTGSRDKSVMIWDIVERTDTDSEKEWGLPRKILKGKYRLLLTKLRTFALHQRPLAFTRQQIYLDWIMGRYSSPLGYQEGSHNQKIRQPYKRRSGCCILPR